MYVGEVDDHFEPVAEAFRRLMGRGPGGGALVVRMGGRTVVDLHTGHADRAGRRPWDGDTLAISFSTTKGVASTVIHRLAERGLIDYEEPVATYWPEFGAGGKDRILVRHLLTHRAGLHSLRPVARRGSDLLDHVAVEDRLAATPSNGPTRNSGYHAITYGYLLSGLTRRLTGRGMAQLMQEEVAEPLGLEHGMHLGVGPGQRDHVAEPIGVALRGAEVATRVFAPLWTRIGRTRTAIDALYVPGFDRLFDGAEPPIWATEMPAVNGAFSAGALARLYGALANGGQEEGRRLLAPATVQALGRVQVRGPDVVLGLPMRWRLGYHQAFGTGQGGSRAFGHYGFGGSGAWADPTLGLSLGFVTNRIGSVTTPLGDLTLYRLSGVVRDCAARAFNTTTAVSTSAPPAI